MFYWKILLQLSLLGVVLEYTSAQNTGAYRLSHKYDYIPLDNIPHTPSTLASLTNSNLPRGQVIHPTTGIQQNCDGIRYEQITDQLDPNIENQFVSPGPEVQTPQQVFVRPDYRLVNDYIEPLWNPVKTQNHEFIFKQENLKEPVVNPLPLPNQISQNQQPNLPQNFIQPEVIPNQTTPPPTFLIMVPEVTSSAPILPPIKQTSDVLSQKIDNPIREKSAEAIENVKPLIEPEVATKIPLLKRNQLDKIFEEQARSAKYSFGTSIQDGINDNSHLRKEVRDGIKLRGMYSYSDGFYKRTVHYEADDKGYRVVKEDVQPIGDGPQINEDGQARVQATVGNDQILNYSIRGRDIKG